MIKLQNLLLPKKETCLEEQMFFQSENGNRNLLDFNESKGTINFSDNAVCRFNTYFNSFTVEKWRKYTGIQNICLVLRLSGSFKVVLLSNKIINGALTEHIIFETNCESVETNDFYITFPNEEYTGILSFKLIALKDKSVYYGGYYGSENKEKLWDVNIAINICTYKRETYIERNINILKKYILNDSNNELGKHLRIYISDNGQTLDIDKLSEKNIHIVKNKNAGGASGFTRGMIEAIEHKEEFPASHILMMDDDIVIEPEALFRTYMLLRCRKEEYKDMSIGGAMLRLDQRNIQVESGASWNAGALISNKANYDLNNLSNIILNEKEEYTEYNAWWYCCVPMDIIREDNLPLPIFIRGDDVEYGLRNMKTLVLLNGICVWHESFENKYSSYLQYYILRNMLYDNSLHFQNWGTLNFLKRLYKNVGRELLYYRYQNVDLIFKGVNDFFKGIKFLEETDGESLHKEIMAMGYKTEPITNYIDEKNADEECKNSLEETETRSHRIIRIISGNGYLLPAKRNEDSGKIVHMALCKPIHFFRHKAILNYDPNSKKAFKTEKSLSKALGCFCRLIGITIKAVFHYKKAVNDIRSNYCEITNIAFWKNYLELDDCTNK